MISFTYPGRLPGMNEIIKAAKSNPHVYAAMKRQNCADVAVCIGFKYHGEDLGVPRYQRVAVMVDWFEPNAKRDPDNVMAGQKFIFDALVHKGIIADDDQKHVASITHRFNVDAANPRVVVEVYEV